MEHEESMSASDALSRLKWGNSIYVKSEHSMGDISPSVRLNTATRGQAPYAVIIACSDSRVIPEAIFSTGIGELFVIRVAGNVIDDHQLGSIEYATEHLGCRLVIMLGHTGCGAVAAALERDSHSRYIKYVLEDVREAIGEEKDPYKASLLNIRHCVDKIETSMEIQKEEHELGLKVMGAIYNIKTGKVDFLQR